MVRKQKKETTLVHVKIAKEISDRLEAYCEAEERTKTYAIEHALMEFLDKYENENNQ